jgi:hypothetical protein
MGGPKGPKRGPKTHRADMKLNRGEHREPEPEMRADDGEEHESRAQEQAREEHPTRKTQAGYTAQRGHRS